MFLTSSSHISKEVGLRELLALVNQRFGPIVHIKRCRLKQPRWWIYSCLLARPVSGVRAWDRPQLTGSGSSLDEGEALIRALGESAERYVAMNNQWDAEVRYLATVDAESLFEQFPRCASHEPCIPSLKIKHFDRPIAHVPVRNLMDDRLCYAPVAQVHLNYIPGDHEPTVSYPISTGLAFHPEFHVALFAGLCEVIERDAIMLTWWTRKRATRINLDVPALPWSLADRIQRLRFAGLEAHLFDISTELRFPVVLAVLGAHRFPYLTVGASCKASVVDACCKALDEAIAVRWFLETRGQRSLPSTRNFEWVEHLTDHAWLYACWPSREAFEFLFEDAQQASINDVVKRPWWNAPRCVEDIRALAEHMHDLGYSTWYAELGSPPPPTSGCVVKVLAPGLLPLSQSHRARWLDQQRLTQALLREGGTTKQINPYPHPFA